MGTYEAFVEQITSRMPALLKEAESGTIKQSIDLMTDAVAEGGVIRAFGTGHSEAFCMELAGRAGGLIPTSRMSLRDMVIYGDKTAADLTP
ncbi:MAG TPA: SIS domain-containing protein, partial [Propionibacteriaceae bacterium]|nr:SIS domain-containing protein [Propionibacteriaceae bacterium]